jgi:hypothetical protein
MSRTVERYQNPAVDDTITLRLFTYNSNNLSDLSSIDKIDVYFLDPYNVSAENPDGRRLVETFDSSVVTAVETGAYLFSLAATGPKYTIGRYIDVWTVRAVDDQPAHEVVNRFQIYPNLWYTTPIPVVYDFSFRFIPNKFRKGSRQYLIIEIIPNVPTAGDLRQYYENIAIVSDLRISIEQSCGDCLPAERDLRLIADKELVDFREKRHGYYQLDTEDMDCGIYDIWFQLDFGGNRYISDRMHFQVFD